MVWKFIAAVAGGALLAAPSTGQLSDRPVLERVPFTSVVVRDGFWSPRLATLRKVTVRHVLDMCEKTGRVENFEVASGAKQGGMKGYFFNDSDVYKAIEGAAFLLQTEKDPDFESRCDAVIEKIAAAQQPDGYLYSSRSIMDPKNPPPGGKERWSDMAMGHELYCAGHLYEAGVAYHAATGKRKLLDVAIKNADLVASVFGPGKDPHPCGHPEIEIGLATLYKATGDKRYLDLIKFFVDTRGRADGRQLYGEYSQDHIPVLDQSEAVGHAVRLAYLQAGMLDLAALSLDQRYIQASVRVWDDIVGNKLYITGGVGSQGNNEGFGAPFDLPNSSAYNETCSSIAFAMWSHRLFLATGDGKYLDVMERTLYNALLAGWSLSGDRFFYANPLEATAGRERTGWFDCACCPPNVVRFFASLPSYTYAAAGRDVYVSLFTSSEASLDVAGSRIRLVQETRYPWEGEVLITVDPAAPQRFSLHIRSPGWARGEVVPGGLYRFAGEGTEIPRVESPGGSAEVRLDRGFFVIEREWKAGDQVRVRLPMPVRRITANERVRADAGRAAMQRGPLVYCFEATDQTDRHVTSFVNDAASTWEPDFAASTLGGIVRLTGKVRVAERTKDGSTRAGPEVDAVAIPYYSWANRGPAAMCVWSPARDEAAKPKAFPTIAWKARATTSAGGDASALADQLEPSSSRDHDNPYLHWWPRKGTEEWVQYEFPTPVTVSGVEVYWFDDTGRGECRLPKSWTIQAKVNGAWREVTGAGQYGVRADTYNRCDFDPTLAEALRLVVRSQDGWAGGIHEWRVIGAD